MIRIEIPQHLNFIKDFNKRYTTSTKKKHKINTLIKLQISFNCRKI